MGVAVDYLAANIAVDDGAVSFSWTLTDTTRGSSQAAYSVVVVDAASGARVWDSGTVLSNASAGVVYGGSGNPPSAPLTDDADYTVAVSVVSSSGCQASATGVFSTALLVASRSWDALGAEWVGGSTPDVANLLRAEVSLPWAPVRARLYVAALGAHKAVVNGVAVDAHQLGPFTQYQMRTPYHVANVTRLLGPGCNALGLTLGAGRYLHGPGLGVHRTARIVLSVTGPGGEALMFVSNASTSAVAAVVRLGPAARAVAVARLPLLSSVGPVTADDVFDGERYDARLEQPGYGSCGFAPPDAAAPWLPVIPSPLNTTGAPRGGPAMSSIKVPTAVGRVWATVGAVAQPYPGVFVADAGQGQAGYCALRIPAGACAAGQTVTVSYGESLGADGTVFDCRTSTDSYTCAGAPAYAAGVDAGSGGSYDAGAGSGWVTYAPSFSYRGYRWVQVEGYPAGALPDEALVCYSLHAGVLAPVPPAPALVGGPPAPPSPASAGWMGGGGGAGSVSPGGFTSGSPLLNAIQRAVTASALANLMEVPTDDPNRSRAGWLGDAQLAADVNLLTLGGGGGPGGAAPLAAYYRTWLDTVADTQAYFAAAFGTNGSLPDELPWFTPTRIPGDMVCVRGRRARRGR
jgi:alpha-L-rhamnosidase